MISENQVTLAAMLRDALSPGGSSESARAARRATLARSAEDVVRPKFPVFAACDQIRHVSMIVDSGAEAHVVCPALKHFLTNVTNFNVPLQLETDGGDLTLDVVGGLLCGGIVCHGSVFNPLLSVSLFSAARAEKGGYFWERCPGGYGVLKGPRGNVELKRSGGLDYLVESEEQCFFCCFPHT